MEIKEMVSYYLNAETNIIEVAFRTFDDDEETLRNDLIDLNIIVEYGFDIVTKSFDIIEENDESEGDIGKEEIIEIDQDELITFLNEYYMINPHQLPKISLY